MIAVVCGARVHFFSIQPWMHWNGTKKQYADARVHFMSPGKGVTETRNVHPPSPSILIPFERDCSGGENSYNTRC